MKKLIIISFIILLIYSCQNSTDIKDNSSLPHQKDNFFARLFKLEANTDKVELDSIVIITAKCTPIFNGTGLFTLLGKGMADSSKYIIIYPGRDTTMVTSNNLPKYIRPVTFTANKEFLFTWKIILKSKTDYSFTARAIFNSINVKDSSELYNYESKVYEPYQYHPVTAINPVQFFYNKK